MIVGPTIYTDSWSFSIREVSDAEKYQILIGFAVQESESFGLQIQEREEKSMRKRLLSMVVFLCVLLTLGSVPVKATAEDEAKTVDVMFLHDPHSHLNEFSTVEEGEAQTLGGFAKFKTLIN